MEETIDLREVIDILLKGKWLIAIIVVVCILLASIASWLIIPEKYESKAAVQIASNAQDTEILASYIAYEFTPQVFSQRVKNETIINEGFQNEGLKNEFNQKSLSVTQEPNTNLINLTYTSDSSTNAQKELQTIISITKNEMNKSVQKTLQDLESTYKTESESLTGEIESIIKEYNSIIQKNNLPEILILQTILNTDIVLNISEEQTKALSNLSGPLQNQLLQLQAQIQAKSEEYRRVLADYQSVKTGIESFKPDPFIRVIVEPTLAENSASPNILLNLVIGLVLGLMIGFGLVFFREYWRNSAPLK
ncbi:Wzz/FepE/Etk N-terminal domain-containing protein [Lysinibacillus telephonicus]|uniref:Wzz/FepE/Etk N-terminal domain-containing protein n=1 Tax=Lysinibacillus telephonicus TaxID=1714840 RepID=UPI003B9E977E